MKWLGNPITQSMCRIAADFAPKKNSMATYGRFLKKIELKYKVGPGKPVVSMVEWLHLQGEITPFTQL